MRAGGFLFFLVGRYFIEKVFRGSKKDGYFDLSKLSKDPSKFHEVFSKFKRDLLKDFANGDFGLNVSFHETLSEALRFSDKYTSGLAEGLSGAGLRVLVLDAVLRGLGKVGLGSGRFYTVFEQGLEIDPLLGLPYYPGSSLKGAARAFCEAVLKGTGGDGVDLVCGRLFGRAGDRGDSEGSVGLAHFLPAYPVYCLKGEGPCTVYWPDVTTPHYYSGGRPVKGETFVQPNPILSLSISPGLVFRFIVYETPGRSQKLWKEASDVLRSVGDLPLFLKNYAGDPLMVASFFLVEALSHGFAARSAKGYNVFRLLRSSEERAKTYKVIRMNISGHETRSGGAVERRSGASGGSGRS